jgi:hypothetical protein
MVKQKVFYKDLLIIQMIANFYWSTWPTVIIKKWFPWFLEFRDLEDLGCLFITEDMYIMNKFKSF